jgi:hypothetical protein
VELSNSAKGAIEIAMSWILILIAKPVTIW